MSKSYIVNNTGRVAFIHKLNNDNTVTITQNGTILIWYIDQTWLPISRKDINPSDTNISFSCLSHKKTYLAVLKESYDLILYTFHENEIVVPTRIEMELYYVNKFALKVTYCDISQDEQYIAVGLETGLIIVSLFYIVSFTYAGVSYLNECNIAFFLDHRHTNEDGNTTAKLSQ